MKITNRKDKKKLAHNPLAVFTTDALLDEPSGRGSNSVEAAWGRIGGQSGYGQAKARSSDQAQNAAKARGAKARKEKLANDNNNGVPAARARTRLNE